MNTEDDIKLPMDEMDDLPPAIPESAETPEQRSTRERDEGGRFKAAGEPDDGAAARRERQERDSYKREAEEAKAAHAALQKRLDDMGAIAKGEEPNAEPLDPLKPIGEKLDALDNRFKQQDEQRQAEEVHRQVMTYAEQDEQRFRAEKADFPNAIQHYITSRLTEMQALGVDQQQAEQILAQEANDLLYQSARAGRSAAGTIYAMAQARGYQTGVVEQAPRQAAPQNFGGRSLGSGGGAAGGAVTAQQIAAMNEDDYMAYRATPEGKRAIQRAMGA